MELSELVFDLDVTMFLNEFIDKIKSQNDNLLKIYKDFILFYSEFLIRED